MDQTRDRHHPGWTDIGWTIVYGAREGPPSLAPFPELLGRGLDQDPERFEKMIAYLHSPVGQRVCTNHHVERTSRRLRSLEKVRDKGRRRTIVRFVVLAVERSWK